MKRRTLVLLAIFAVSPAAVSTVFKLLFEGVSGAVFWPLLTVALLSVIPTSALRGGHR